MKIGVGSFILGALTGVQLMITACVFAYGYSKDGENEKLKEKLKGE